MSKKIVIKGGNADIDVKENNGVSYRIISKDANLTIVDNSLKKPWLGRLITGVAALVLSPLIVLWVAWYFGLKS